jgi:hypothetical protein
LFEEFTWAIGDWEAKSVLRLLSLMWMACTVQALVQVQPPTRPPQTQDGGTRKVLESIAIPPLANAPFSGTLVTEWTRPMADGGNYTLTNRRRIARDSAGRIYEERWLLVPKGSDTAWLAKIRPASPAYN